MQGLSILIVSALLALMLVGLFVPIGARDKSTDDTEVGHRTARQRFVLPKQFNFDYFQRLFDKHYSTATERLVRAKLYLGRAFRAFISKISYKHARSSSYLGINRMSDWTPEEIKRTMMKRDIYMAGAPIEAATDQEETPREDHISDDVPVADLPSIESTLEDIVENKASQPAFECIAKELGNTDLSNGVDDQATRLISDGDRDEVGSKVETISEEEADSIQSLKSTDFLHNIVRKFANLTLKQNPNSASPVPDTIYTDHRSCLPEPRAQYLCGSCYMFSTIALYEWAYCKATGTIVAFSEQYPLDCGRSRHIKGCNGGLPSYVRDFQLLNGLQVRHQYPYMARDQECLFDPAAPVESRNFVRIYDQGAALLKIKHAEKDLKRGPVVMAIFAEAGVFHEYSGGVDMGHNCYGVRGGPHGMLLVGSGREDGEEYWLLRNSFGPDWGEQGYYKLNKKSDCITDDHGLVLKFSSTPKVRTVTTNQIEPLPQ